MSIACAPLRPIAPKPVPDGHWGLCHRVPRTSHQNGHRISAQSVHTVPTTQGPFTGFATQPVLADLSTNVHYSAIHKAAHWTETSTSTRSCRSSTSYSSFRRNSRTSSTQITGVTKRKASPTAPRCAPLRQLAHSVDVWSFSKPRTVQWGARVFSTAEYVPKDIVDIDVEDEGYPEMAFEYAKEIYSYLGELERKHHVGAILHEGVLQPGSMQSDMRSAVIDWLITIHAQMGMTQETLFLASSLFDRYLERESVTTGNIELFSICCLMIASKFEESSPLLIQEALYFLHHAFTREDLVAAELKICLALKFEIGTAYPLHFLRRMSKSADASPQAHTLGKYLIELCLVGNDMIKYKPSEWAASALLLSRHILGEGNGWDATIQHYSGYTENDIEDCINDMLLHLHRLPQSPYKATHKKYSERRFFMIAKVVDNFMQQCPQKLERPNYAMVKTWGYVSALSA